jgi:hypothetical protein
LNKSYLCATHKLLPIIQSSKAVFQTKFSTRCLQRQDDLTSCNVGKGEGDVQQGGKDSRRGETAGEWNSPFQASLTISTSVAKLVFAFWMVNSQLCISFASRQKSWGDGLDACNEALGRLNKAPDVVLDDA